MLGSRRVLRIYLRQYATSSLTASGHRSMPMSMGCIKDLHGFFCNSACAYPITWKKSSYHVLIKLVSSAMHSYFSMQRPTSFIPIHFVLFFNLLKSDQIQSDLSSHVFYWFMLFKHRRQTVLVNLYLINDRVHFTIQRFNHVTLPSNRIYRA